MTPKTLIIAESNSSSGYNDISTVYAYYTPEEKAIHGKHCESWTEFGFEPGLAPYRTHCEREFIEQVEAENSGHFASYLISWSGCD